MNLRRTLVALIVGASMTGPASARASDELSFQISLAQWPIPFGEHVRLRAWITNNSDRPVRIPSELTHFVFPEALQPPDNKPEIAVSILVPQERVESVVLPPGGFYGCILEHMIPEIGFWQVWFRFVVPKSEANPDLWTGELVSNKVILSVDDPR